MNNEKKGRRMFAANIIMFSSIILYITMKEVEHQARVLSLKGPLCLLSHNLNRTGKNY